VTCAANRWISVIDPDPLSRDALRASLAGLGAEVRTYFAAEPFLAALQDTLPVCLISEVRLPAMSGLMLLRHLKSVGKGVPAILIATDPEISLAVEVIREGALDFFEKPFPDDRIARRVEALLSL
jgi:two-component system C4-dicarboxylate transport response regulator DctD